jgi:hypothetical protein
VPDPRQTVPQRRQRVWWRLGVGSPLYWGDCGLEHPATGAPIDGQNRMRCVWRDVWDAVRNRCSPSLEVRATHSRLLSIAIAA